jgi:tRNA A-37 threonylcarbamoyl transferase component Bud32
MSEDTAATLLPDAARADALLGRVIDARYRLLEKLGEGGMGAVFVAEHLALKKQVALKTIHSTLEGHAEITARFAREAMVSARVEHPNVVSALDYGTLDGGGAYLVLQLVRGEGLRACLERDGALPWRRACALAQQIADAAAAAHAAGIVHRDLKPENVVLERSEDEDVTHPHVKVLDFGIAHLRADAAQASTVSGAPLTQLGTIMGTPGYMAPEQAVGQAVDERTDIYALGVMLWEMLAGRRPFQGNSLTEIVTQQFAPRPPALPRETPPLPEALAVLVGQMLAAQPEDRPATAVEVRDRLRALAGAGPESQLGASGSGLGARLRNVGLAFVALGAVLAALWMWRALPNWTRSAPDEAATKVRAAPAPQAARSQPTRSSRAVEAAAPSDELAERTQGAVTAPEPDDSQQTASRAKTGRARDRRQSEAKREGARPRPVQRVKRAIDALFR